MSLNKNCRVSLEEHEENFFSSHLVSRLDITRHGFAKVGPASHIFQEDSRLKEKWKGLFHMDQFHNFCNKRLCEAPSHFSLLHSFREKCCKEIAGFHHHEATVHMAHCCNEGVMFFPLIYPDYTIKRESRLMEPSVPALHLPICLLSSLNFCRTFGASLQRDGPALGQTLASG